MIVFRVDEKMARACAEAVGLCIQRWKPLGEDKAGFVLALGPTRRYQQLARFGYASQALRRVSAVCHHGVKAFVHEVLTRCPAARLRSVLTKNLRLEWRVDNEAATWARVAPTLLNQRCVCQLEEEK